MKKAIHAILIPLLLSFPPLMAQTTTQTRILTKFNIEKVASCSTANMQYICMQDEGGNLTMMAMDLKTMYAKSLKTIFRPNTIKGPEKAPSNIRNVSEPQLPKYGNYVSFIGSSNNRRYLVSIDSEGKTMKTALLPETNFDGITVIWDLMWFRLNYNGQTFMGVARGTVVEKGKKGTCFAIIVMDTDGTNLFFLNRPKWTGTKFEYSRDGAGQLISPIGFSRNSMRVFFKSRIGTTTKNGVYACDWNGGSFRLVATMSGAFTPTVTATKVWSLDLVTDDGKYLVLNDNGLGHKGSVSMDTASGAILARLPDKTLALSNDGIYAFFKSEKGFSIGFIIGGEPHMIVRNTDEGYPALGKLNRRNTGEPPVCCITQSPFAYVGRSDTDVRGKGQLYYTEIISPPKPPSAKLVIEPPVIDIGIISEATSSVVGIRNPGQTAISGRVTIENGADCLPFSFGGKHSVSFNEIGDIKISVDPKCMDPGTTKEASIKVASTGGNAGVFIVATMDNPERALGKLGLGRNECWIGTRLANLKAAPFLESGSSYIPMDFLREIIPCDYTWNAEEKTALIEYQDINLELTVDSTDCLVSGAETTLSKPPLMKDGMVFLPASLLKDAYGCKLEFYSKTQTLVVDFPKPFWGRESIEVDGLPEHGDVFLNNQKVGVSPLTLRHLQPGSYWVKVLLDGYEDYEKIIDIPPSPSNVFYFLQRIIPKTTLFEITSKPSGAYVYINDSLIGVSPQKLELKPGMHRIKIVMSGFPEYITDVVALKGEEVKVHADLDILKERFANFVNPKEFNLQVTLPKQRQTTFDMTVKNESGLPQAYKITCPKLPSKGFDGISIETLDGNVSELVTPSISPGETLRFRFIVKTDDFASPGDLFQDRISVVSTTLATWKMEIPFKVELTGKNAEPPTIFFEHPEKVRMNESFDVKFKIAGALDLHSCKFRFTYQSNRVSIYDIAEGDMLNSGSVTLFGWKEFLPGEATVVGPARLSRAGLDGDGTLLVLTFKAVKDGDLILDCANIELYDPDGERIEINPVKAAVIPIDKP